MRTPRIIAWPLLLIGLVPSPAAASGFPSLDQQLLQDHVKPGSALAKLIAANQDFSLLRAEEADDRLRLPPWLRVVWRRAHPTGTYPAKDPTGGYPLLLHEIHEWLVTHQDLRPGTPEPAGGPREVPSETGEQRISGAQTTPRSESDIRINFNDPTKIIGAANNIGGSGGQAEFYSTDGGISWGQTNLALQPGEWFQGDPTVGWTSDGTAWSLTIGIDFSFNLFMRAYKSTDNGATWSFDTTISNGTENDKELMWVDDSASSPHKDNVYAIWHNGAPVIVNHRTGPGGSWGSPIQVSGAETTGTGIGAEITTNASGDVFAAWPDTGSQGLYVARSTDGGASFGAAVHVASTAGSFQFAIPADSSRRVLIYTSIAASGGNLFLAWTDLATATGCSSFGPGTDVSSPCKTRIWFSRSTDSGGTWSAPVMVNNQSGLNDQFFQRLTLDPANGQISIVYYDTVDDPGRLKTDVWYQSSTDGGLTWSAPFRITTAMTDETASGSDFGNQYGDYIGLSGFNGIYLPSWTDRRAGASEEIWTAAVQDTPCSAPGPPAIGSATAPADHQIQVSWTNGAPAASSFAVYRAAGTCASAGTFSRIASGVGGSSFLDTTVSGTLTYAYEVSGLDATGHCESARSSCVEATATGSCTAAPSFAGAAAAANRAAATCTVSLSWAPGSATCTGHSLTYNVYRGTLPTFTPAPANRIASGVTGTSYDDLGGLSNATTYFYIVRAVDSSNGAEDGNLVARGAFPTGPFELTETFEGGASGGGFDHPGWTHQTLSGGVDWTLSTSQSQTPTHSWYAADVGSVADMVLVSPTLNVRAGSLLTFWHTYAFEGSTSSCYDGGTLEASTNGGATWAVVPDSAFLAGGFTGTVNSNYLNPLAHDRAWCAGTIGPMTQVIADLSAFANQVKLRWHEGSDDSFGVVGWYVDSVALTNACTATPTGLGFYTLPPCRLVDTRNAAGPLGGPALAAVSLRTFPFTGACGVPLTAQALSINVTVTQPAAGGYLSLFAADLGSTDTSVINFRQGQTRASNTVVALPGDGSGGVKVLNGTPGTVHLVIDVNGYFQ
jgi:hypothetical protein